MIDMVQPILFILILVMVVHESVILASAYSFRETYSCAKGVDIDDPFWIADRSLGEGCTNYPGFEVKCGIDGTPFINISNNFYTVLRSDYGYITVREAAINGQECPQPQLNFSTGFSRFLTLHSPENNMTIFYNCSSTPPNIEAQGSPCLNKYYNNSTKHSYAFQGGQIPIGFDWYGNCEKSVFTYIRGDSSSNVEALQQGFYLDYKVPVSCRDCESSGGRCSSNETTGAITCLCPGDIKKIDDVSPPKVSAGFCRTNTSCGNGVKINEPFWIGDGSPGEGCTNYPGFRVKCASDGTPVMNISNGLYTVLSPSKDDYDEYDRSGYIRVREADINGQECPQPLQNLSISSTRFLSVEDTDKMRIFYNCSSPPPNIQAQEIRCLEKHYNNSTKHSYGFPDAKIPEGFDWYGNCEKNVLAYTDSYTDLVKALRGGVELKWKTPANCTDCELSGGQCTPVNKTTGAFACYCPRGFGQLIDEICPPGYPYDHIPTIDLSIKRRIVIGVSAGVGSSILIFILLCIFRKRIYNSIVSYWRKKIKNMSNVEVFLENCGYLAIQRYKYSDIKKLTNLFKETLGQGGYGSVFKGKLHDGRLVAMKVLNEAKGKGEDSICNIPVSVRCETG